MSISNNKDIFDKKYKLEQYIINVEDPYDLHITNIKKNLLHKYSEDRVCLDLCCGAGAYLRFASNVTTIYALDYSENVIKLIPPTHRDIYKIVGQAEKLPLQNKSIEFIFSMSALYYIKNLNDVISEINRVLAPGGYALLDFGVKNTLGYFASLLGSLIEGWAKPNCPSYPKLLELLEGSELRIVEIYSYRLFPMFGTKKMQLLYPICTPLLKKVMAIKYKKITIEEYILRIKFFKKYAFRQLILVKK